MDSTTGSTVNVRFKKERDSETAEIADIDCFEIYRVNLCVFIPYGGCTMVDPQYARNG